MPVSSKEFLDIQATIECAFTLKRVRDMTRTYSQYGCIFVDARLNLTGKGIKKKGMLSITGSGITLTNNEIKDYKSNYVFRK